MDKNEGYIRFDFSPVKQKTSMHYYVLAESLDEMHMFLNQHGFHNVDSSLVFYPIEKYKSTDSTHVLHEYRFMSNHKPGVFTVMTCENFITHAIETTANDLSDASLFGEAILRTDIEIFKVISSLINRLSHGHVIDIQIADESVLYNMENEDKIDRWELMESYCNRIGAPTEDVSSRVILEEIYDAVPDLTSDNGIYPITVEAYVSSFTELMIDCFN